MLFGALNSWNIQLARQELNSKHTFNMLDPVLCLCLRSLACDSWSWANLIMLVGRITIEVL